MKVLLFGTGHHYQKYKKWFSGMEILALLDNDLSKQGLVIDGYDVVAPQCGIQRHYELIYILSAYQNEMRAQLLNLGVSSDCIRIETDLRMDILAHRIKRRDIIVYEDRQIDSFIYDMSGVLLISYELLLNGAGIALLYVATVLRKNGYSVVVASMQDGPLREEFLKIGVTVVIDENMQVLCLADLAWTYKFSLIFVNTVDYYRLLFEVCKDIPIIWWLHEPKMLYTDVILDEISSMSFRGIDVYAVSRVAKEAFERYRPDVLTSILLCGIPDTYVEKHQKSREKFIFAVIGTISPIKGQALFIKAIQRMNPVVRKQCEFWIVGNCRSAFAQNLLRQKKMKLPIRFLGELDRRTIHDVYNRIDVLVCPSLEETLSIVSSEAMMHNKPCIVSSGVGIADFIKDKQNGLFFETGNIDDLDKTMEWAVLNREVLSDMGHQARYLYERLFSIESFSSKLLAIVREKMIKKISGGWRW